MRVDSRFSKDPANPSKPAKLYFNADGSAPDPNNDNSLAAQFKKIADELSNLRIARLISPCARLLARLPPAQPSACATETSAGWRTASRSSSA